MANVITVDFRGAPPAQGGGASDHIPRGRYLLRVEKAASGTAGTGRTMVNVDFRVSGGEQEGARLRDGFGFPMKADDNKFGLQRFHAFLLALGMPVKEAVVKFDLDRLVGRTVVSDVDDNTIPARGEYAARTVSRPVAYYSLAETQQAASTAPKAAPAKYAPAPTEALAEVAADVDDLFR